MTTSPATRARIATIRNAIDLVKADVEQLARAEPLGFARDALKDAVMALDEAVPCLDDAAGI